MILAASRIMNVSVEIFEKDLVVPEFPVAFSFNGRKKVVFLREIHLEFSLVKH